MTAVTVLLAIRANPLDCADRVTGGIRRLNAAVDSDLNCPSERSGMRIFNKAWARSKKGRRVAISKRQVWGVGDTFKARDGKVYFVVEASERTVTMLRVAWMWDKDDDLAISSATETRRKGDLYRQLRAKYSQELERHRSPSVRQGNHAAEYVVLADGSKLRSTRRLGPAALKRLEDAAGVFKFRIVRATFSGPIKSPADALFRKYNEYSAISSDDPGNPKLHAIFVVMSNLLEEGVLPPQLVDAFIVKIESEFRNFHSPSAPSKAAGIWKKDRMIELIYSDSVKVNKAYQKRAERYVRQMINEIVRQQDAEEDRERPAS